jgi:hypothetical protein
MGNESPTTLDVANAAHTLVENALTAPPKTLRVVSPRVARHALWFLGDNENWAVQPGRFDELLFSLIAAADEENLVVLEGAYPEQFIAFRDGRKHWGLEWLRKIAREAD